MPSDDKKDKKKAPPSKSKGPPSSGPPSGAPPMGADVGMPPMGMGPPPMPGTGFDPYAALAGQISQAPPPGGMGGGPEMGGGDPLSAALMSGMDPSGAGAPPMPGPPMGAPPMGGMGAGGDMVSIQALLQLLTMLSGGMPNSGLNPAGGGGDIMAGLGPGGTY